MITKVEINQSERKITVNYLNTNPVNIWALVGGV